MWVEGLQRQLKMGGKKEKNFEGRMGGEIYVLKSFRELAGESARDDRAGNLRQRQPAKNLVGSPRKCKSWRSINNVKDVII